MTRPPPATLGVARPGVGAGLVDSLVAELQRVAGQRSPPALVGMGLAVLDALFEGSGEQYLRHGARSASLRRLLAHPDLPVTPAKLKLGVRLAEQHRFLGPVAQLLTCAHQVELLAAPPQSRGPLAERCVREAWTARELGVRVDESGRAIRSGVGRPRLPAGARALREVVRRARDPLLGDALRGCAPEHRHALRTQLHAAADALRALAEEGLPEGAHGPAEYPSWK